MFMIDNVFKKSMTDQETFIERLKREILINPDKFENEFRNLKSFVIDIQEEKLRIEKLHKMERDQLP